EGGADESRRVLRPRDALCPFGERAQDADLVRNFVQEAMALADRAAGDLADQRKDARPGRIGGRERRGAVEESRARDDRIDGRPASRERGAKRHVGGALFVPRVHDLERVAGVEHGIEQMVALDSGQTVDRRKAMSDERSDDGVTAAHQRHCCSPIAREIGRPDLIVNPRARPVGPSICWSFFQEDGLPGQAGSARYLNRSLSTSFHFSDSPARKAAKVISSSYATVAVSVRTVACTAGVFGISPTSAESLLTTAGGVPAGANSPMKPPARPKPGTPSSAIVGISGAAAERFTSPTPSARRRPAIMCG